MKNFQKGGFILGMVVGLLIGLALALGVALYITKAPVPFINKVPQRTAEHDRVEAERNKQWNPNAPLGTRSGPPGNAGTGVAAPGAVALPGPASAPMAGAAPAAAPAKDPAGMLSGKAKTDTSPAVVAAPAPAASAAKSTAAPLEAFVYFVQAGAYTRSEDAEQQRARLALMGLSARITEREQSGRTVYRVRTGPYAARTEADTLQQRLQDQGIEAQIVRVDRP